MRVPRAKRRSRFIRPGAWLMGLILLHGLTGLGLDVSHGAQITPLSNPNSFFPGATLITFQGLQPFARPTNWAGVGFITLDGRGPDVTFDPSPPREFGPDEKTTIQNIASGLLGMNMYLPGPMVQLGFEMRTEASQNINLTLFAGGSAFQTVTIPTRTIVSSGNSEFYFYAFQSSTPFDRVLVNVGGSEGFFEIDNLRFATIPEPGALALGACGLVLWQGAKQRRRVSNLPRRGKEKKIRSRHS